MRHESYSLTNNELEIMELFWEQKVPMTSADLAEYVPAWRNNGYLHTLLRGLELKGFLKTIDRVSVTTRSAKLYTPIMSKEDYAAHILEPLHMDADSVPKLTLAMVDRFPESQEEQIVAELEKMIARLREKTLPEKDS
ncbi:MAG: BlaI/MecI/CopY family transcriptional regulator [Clostridiales bacterium]|nr:BlaI/MecI/CopY family transcriptional regulator [Clostridiales bacterium]